MSFANDSLATTLPLQYDALVLAGAFLQLAAVLTGAPLGPPHLEWALQAALPQPALRDVAAQVYAFYRAAGNARIADLLAERLGLDAGDVPQAHGSPLSDAPEAEVPVAVAAPAPEPEPEAAPAAPQPEPDAGAQEAAKRSREEEEAERLASLAPQRRVKLA